VKGRGRVALCLVLVGTMAASAAAGCIGTTRDFYGFRAGLEYRNPAVFPGNYTGADQNGSFVLFRGFLPYGDPEIVRLRSPRGASAAGSLSESENSVFNTMAIWRPIDGFLNKPIPVIIHAGPYFEVGQHCTDGSPPQRCPMPSMLVNNTITYPDRMTSFLLRNFVPQGFAVVQLAVRGTGTSGGCMELMGPNEAADLDQAVTWLAQQDWANGNVSMIGVSYAGSTPWMAASFENEHLRAIVPIEGLPDIFGLMFHNGTAETRGPTIYPLGYWPYGFGTKLPVPAPSPLPPAPGSPIGQANGRESQQDRQNLVCRSAYEGFAAGVAAVATGERTESATSFWTQRDYRGRVLANYKGAVFLVHGLQDWNVDPHAAVPFNQRLREAGIDVREWYGQWPHATPDAVCRKDAVRWFITPCRLDFAEVLYRFFDHELRGNTSVELGPPVQVQDNRGFWRIADAFPSPNATWSLLYPTVKGQFSEATSTPAAVTLLPPEHALTVSGSNQPVHYLEVRSEPFANDTRISGLPRLHLDVEPQGPGGFLTAWMMDEDAQGDIAYPLMYVQNERLPIHDLRVPLIGRAQMDLRFYDGGETSHRLVPGQRVTAKMEFEPLDLLIPKGHRLTVWIFQYPNGDKMSGPVPSPVKLWLGGASSHLDLPLITVDPKLVYPVPGANFPREQDYAKFYALKPAWSNLVSPIQLDSTCGFWTGATECGS
jgi:predicted acyl esterase